MKKLIINLVALIGLNIFTAGIIYAASADCGDDSVKPITVQSTTSKSNSDV